MTRRISLITTIVGAALMLGVPAAWGDNYFADRQDQAIASAMHEDGFDQAVLAAKQNRLSATLDARERALGARVEPQWLKALEARSVALNRMYGVGEVAKTTESATKQPVDARSEGLNRMYGLGKYHNPVADSDRFRIDHSNVPTPPSVTSSGREIEWPQIGIGFGIGFVLILGLVLALKATRTPPVAH